MEKVRQRIESRAVVDSNGCWILKVGLTALGYSRLMIDRELDLGHRWSYRAYKGDIPVDKLVRHTCDVRNCVNPEHLLVGSQSDNILDAVSRGRYVVNKGGAKLTEEQAEYIRNSLDRTKDLAEKFNVSRHTIMNVRGNRTWLSSKKET